MGGEVTSYPFPELTEVLIRELRLRNTVSKTIKVYENCPYL